MNDFYTLLNAFFNTHEPTTTETKDRKYRIMNNAKQLYHKYFDTYKKNYDTEKVKDKEKRGCEYKQFETIDSRDQEPKLTKKNRPRPKIPDEIQNFLQVKLNKNNFDLSI